MADDSEHDKWIAKLSRSGMDVSNLEYLRHDTSLLEAHPLESITRELLRLNSQEMSTDLCTAWFNAFAAWEDHRIKKGVWDPIPVHLEPSLWRAGKTILAEVHGASSNLRRALQLTLASTTQDEKIARESLRSEMELVSIIADMIPESERTAPSDAERSFQRATETQPEPCFVHPTVDLQPDLISHRGSWGDTLRGLRTMHRDAKNSLEWASNGEIHAASLLTNLADVRKRIAVAKVDVVEAAQDLMLLINAAKLHIWGSTEAFESAMAAEGVAKRAADAAEAARVAEEIRAAEEAARKVAEAEEAERAAEEAARLEAEAVEAAKPPEQRQREAAERVAKIEEAAAAERKIIRAKNKAAAEARGEKVTDSEDEGAAPVPKVGFDVLPEGFNSMEEMEAHFDVEALEAEGLVGIGDASFDW